MKYIKSKSMKFCNFTIDVNDDGSVTIVEVMNVKIIEFQNADGDNGGISYENVATGWTASVKFVYYCGLCGE